jgi:hypothetical protein
MLEDNQFVANSNGWDLLPLLEVQPWNSRAVDELSSPDFSLDQTPQGFLQLQVATIQTTPTYVSQNDEQHTLFTILDVLNRLFTNACEVVAEGVALFKEYVSESDHRAHQSRKRLRRKLIMSSAVSKDGHLSFLVPRYHQVCVETAAKDQVLHLEPLTLAEEQEARNSSASGQMQTLGGSLWKTLQSRSRNLVVVPMYASSTN